MNCLRDWNNVNSMYIEHHTFWFTNIYLLHYFVQERYVSSVTLSCNSRVNVSYILLLTLISMKNGWLRVNETLSTFPGKMVLEARGIIVLERRSYPLYQTRSLNGVQSLLNPFSGRQDISLELYP